VSAARIVACRPAEEERWPTRNGRGLRAREKKKKTGAAGQPVGERVEVGTPGRVTEAEGGSADVRHRDRGVVEPGPGGRRGSPGDQPDQRGSRLGVADAGAAGFLDTWRLILGPSEVHPQLDGREEPPVITSDSGGVRCAAGDPAVPLVSRW